MEKIPHGTTSTITYTVKDFLKMEAVIKSVSTEFIELEKLQDTSDPKALYLIRLKCLNELKKLFPEPVGESTTINYDGFEITQNLLDQYSKFVETCRVHAVKKILDSKSKWRKIQPASKDRRTQTERMTSDLVEIAPLIDHDGKIIIDRVLVTREDLSNYLKESGTVIPLNFKQVLSEAVQEVFEPELLKELDVDLSNLQETLAALIVRFKIDFPNTFQDVQSVTNKQGMIDILNNVKASVLNVISEKERQKWKDIDDKERDKLIAEAWEQIRPIIRRLPDTRYTTELYQQHPRTDNIIANFKAAEQRLQEISKKIKTLAIASQLTALTSVVAALKIKPATLHTYIDNFDHPPAGVMLSVATILAIAAPSIIGVLKLQMVAQKRTAFGEAMEEIIDIVARTRRKMSEIDNRDVLHKNK